jgi:trk system potassium uptake protein TrkH
MKSTTFVALIAIMISRIRAKEQRNFFRKDYSAGAYVCGNLHIYALCISYFYWLRFYFQLQKSFSLEQILFETTSAIGTVGLSVGITSSLSTAGKLILVAVMFIGRLGVITFGLAILAKRKKITTKEDEADLAV